MEISPTASAPPQRSGRRRAWIAAALLLAASLASGQEAPPAAPSAVSAAEGAVPAPPEPVLRVDLPPGLPAQSWDSGTVQFIGTATVILRYAGFTVLTDPNFLHRGELANLGYGLKSPRLTEPALPFEKLPPIDLVLLSHYHGDHFDPRVEEKLDRAMPIVSTHHAVRQLRERGFTATHALRTWESIEFRRGDARLRITAMPARHGPPAVRLALPETMGSLLEFRSLSDRHLWRMYVSGDTLAIDALKEIPRRHPGIDLALLHLGGTRVFGVLVTMDARQGVEALRMVDPDLAIPIHYDDYPVFKSPLSDFVRAAREAGLDRKVKILPRGETHEFRVPPARLP